MDVAGWLVLGTKLETKQLEKDLKNEENKLKKYEKQNEILINAKIRIEKSKAMKEYNQLKKAIEDSFSYKINAPDNTETLKQKYIAEQQEAIEDLNKAYADQFDKINEINAKLKDNAFQQEVTRKNIERINSEMPQARAIEQIKQGAQSIKKETESVLKKVAKWGLAIFSIRSAYLMIRRAVSTLSQYNEKLASDLEYIQFALASALQPLIERIIQLVYKLLAYIGYIAKAWFNVDLFANASAKSFAKAKKQLAGTNKEAKELQKTLAGFDEMNILQDGNTRTGGGGGGITLPSTDLGNFDDIEIPGWIQWIADYGPYVVTTLLAIGTAIAGIKLTTFIGGILGVTEGLAGFSAGIGSLLGGLTLLVGSIVVLITQWDNLTLSQKELGVHLAGLGGAFVALGLVLTGLVSGPIGLLIGGLALLASGIAGLIISNNDGAKSTLSVAEASKQLESAQQDLNKATNNYTSALDKNNKMKKQLEEAEKKAKQSGKELYNQVVLGIISFDDMTDTQKELYGKYLDSVEAEEELRKKTIEMQQANDKAAVAEQKKAAAVYASTGKFNDYFNALVKGYEEGKISSQQMQNAVMNIMRSLDDDTRKTFAENLPTSIKNGFQKTLDELGRTDLKIKDVSTGITISYKDIASSTKTTFEKDVPNSVQKSINKVDSLTKSIDNLKKKGNVKMTISTTTTSSSSGMKTGGILKLASGAVINQPGRGVPLKNGVVGGEAGREGILPLTDSQAMAQLGYEIGKNVTINTTLNNYMNSRLMNRELLRTQNEEDFAFNG